MSSCAAARPAMPPPSTATRLPLCGFATRVLAGALDVSTGPALATAVAAAASRSSRRRVMSPPIVPLPVDDSGRIVAVRLPAARRLSGRFFEAVGDELGDAQRG